MTSSRIATEEIVNFLDRIVDQLVRESRTRFAFIDRGGLAVGVDDVLVAINARPATLQDVVNPERILHAVLPFVFVEALKTIQNLVKRSNLVNHSLK